MTALNANRAFLFALSVLCAGRTGAQTKPATLIGPTLEIRGDTDERNLLVNIAHVVPFTDGRIAILCWNDAVIRVFDARGKLIRSSGRKGDGPQELSGLDAGGAYRGDSLWIVDRMWRRISILDAEGRIARRVAISAPMARADANYSGDLSHVIGSLDDGSFVVRTPPRLPLDAPLGAQWYDSELLLYTSDGQRGPSLGLVRYSPVTVRRSGLNADVAVPRFSVATPLAVSHASVLVGSGNGAALTRRTLHSDGRVAIDTVSPSPPSLAVLARHASAARQLERERRIGLERPAAASAELVASKFPAYVRIVPAANGALWLQGPELPGDSTTVSYIAIPGRGITHRVVTPSRFVAHIFNGTSVMGIYRDTDDVGHVRVYHVPLAGHSTP